MAEVTPSTSRTTEDAVELVGEASCNAADGSTSVLPSIAEESPSFLTWMWFQILTACSGVWGARRGGLLGSRMLGLASGAHQTTQEEEEVLSRIAASKATWSEIRVRLFHRSLPVVRSGEPSAWTELKRSAPYFFRDFWADRLKLGRLIAEGGQAQICEAKMEGIDCDYVAKVFKLDAGFSLADLKRHWPRCMRNRSKRKGGEHRIDFRSPEARHSGYVFEHDISNYIGNQCMLEGATLLKDGRFAFLMERYWGDLRTLIDLKVEDYNHPWEFDLLFKNSREQSPFSLETSTWIVRQIALGMEELHALGVLHRDLKAANVLVSRRQFDSMHCDVADYEYAMFVQGTRFWKAPEVLQELQKEEEDRSGEIWTKKVDVYSFGMTCYEVLSGQIPFDEYSKSNWDDVIRGERPYLPDHIHPKLCKLVEACWHIELSQRPSFDDIAIKLGVFHNKLLHQN